MTQGERKGSPSDHRERALSIAMTAATLSGGAGKQIRLLASELSRLGHRVTIFMPRGANRHERSFDGVAVVNVGPRLGQRKYSNFVLRSWGLCAGLLSVDFSRFDVVHSHGWEVAATRSKSKAVRTFYGSAIDEVIHSRPNSVRRLGWLAYQVTGIFLEESTAWTASIRVGISPATKKRVPAIQQVIPCSVDRRTYKPPSPQQRERRLAILSVGTTYSGRKRLWLLHRVFQRHIRPVLPEVELWLVTRAQVSGPGVRCFSELAEADLVEKYQQASVFCLPSLYEGFGVPYIESMACGTPVVASPNSGARWILADGDYGVIAPDGQLAPTLLALLRDEESRREWASRAVRRATEFSSEAMAQRYLDLYRALTR